MADSDSGGGSAGWLGFLAALVLVAVLALAYFGTGGHFGAQRTASLNVNVPTPNVHVNPPSTPSVPHP